MVVSIALVCSGIGVASADPVGSQIGFMQIAAHPDDDLYFMNPELLEGIRAGAPSTTVYLTDGGIQDPLHDRQDGVMAAYAAMAEQWGSSWTGSSVAVADARAEVYTLDARPDIRLIFLNLPDYYCLENLRNTPGSYCITENPASTATGVDDSFMYHSSDVTTAIVQLLRIYRPAGLRTMDALPDSRYQADHDDHIASAEFANEAARQYSATEVSRLFVTSYRGYGNSDLPDNIAADDLYNKRGAIEEYESHAPNAAGDQGWRDPQYERWSRGTNWVGMNSNGTHQAFAVIGDKVIGWRSPTAGQQWSSLTLPSAGGPLAPGLSVANNYDGRLQVLGRRLDTDEIVTIHQTTPGGDFATAWTSFGNPNDHLGTANRSQVGTPIMIKGEDRLLQIFVKNGGGGVSTIYQTDPNNGWWDTNWKDIGGTGIQDDLSAVVNAEGHIELFAQTIVGGREGRLATWYQTDAKDHFAYNPYLVANDLASGPTAIVAPDDKIRVVYRQAHTGNVSMVTQLNVAGAWSQSTQNLGGNGGTRRPSAVRGNNAMLLYARNDTSGISLNWQNASPSGFRGWERMPSVIIDSPAAIRGVGGRLFIYHIGLTGQLYSAQQIDDDGVVFSNWGLVG